MKKIFTLFLTMLIAVMCCGISASADTESELEKFDEQQKQHNAYIHAQLDAYIAEHNLPVLSVNKEMYYHPHRFNCYRYTVICAEETKDAVRTELWDYVRNTLDEDPYYEVIVMTESDVQLKETLEAFIKDRQIHAGVGFNQVRGYNVVEFWSTAYDPETNTTRGYAELKAYMDSIQVGDLSYPENQYEQKIAICFEDGFVEEPTPLRGDINNDGPVDALDAQLVLNNALDLMLDNETEPLAGADLDGDGEVTSLDAQYILMFYLHNDVIGVPTMWRDVIAK